MGRLVGAVWPAPRLDAMGKGKAQQILDFMIAVPADMAAAGSIAQ